MSARPANEFGVFGRLSPNEVKELKALYDPLTWTTKTAKIRLPKAAQQGLSDQLSFEQHPFMVAIYRDTHPHIVGLKGAQLGFSTWLIIRDLWASTTWPMSTIMTLGGVDVGQHVASRINPIINGSEYLAGRILDLDSIHMKRFGMIPMAQLPTYARGKSARIRYLSVHGLSTAYFTAANHPGQAIARDADFLLHDEVDKSDQETIEMFKSRISGPSLFKWTAKISTPTFPGYGIDREYRLSDMRRWLIRCVGCNEYSEMTFPDSLEPQTYAEHVANHPTVMEGQSCPQCYYRCLKCGRRMSDEERALGTWVPEKRDEALPHGYAVSQMAALYISAVDILRARASTVWAATFWNMTMGIAHDEGVAAFTEQAIIGVPGTGDYGRTDPSREMAVASTRGTFMGVDVGGMLDITIDVMEEGRPRTIAIMRVPSDRWDELDRLMERFNVQVAVFDALPELTMVRSFQARWNKPGLKPRVWGCIYAGALSEVRWNDEEARVTVPRVRIQSEVAEELLTVKLLPRYDPGNVEYKEYVKHHVNSKRVPIMQKGLEREGMVAGYDWINVGEDHQFNSSLYAYLARHAPRDNPPPISQSFKSVNRSEVQKQRERESPTNAGLPPARKTRR